MASRGRKGSSKVIPFHPRTPIMDNITAPAYLPPEERALYDKIAAEYEHFNHAAGVILEIACQNHARARACREAIKKEGLQVPAAAGGPKANPLLVTERNAQLQFMLALRRLETALNE